MSSLTKLRWSFIFVRVVLYAIEACRFQVTLWYQRPDAFEFSDYHVRDAERISVVILISCPHEHSGSAEKNLVSTDAVILCRVEPSTRRPTLFNDVYGVPALADARLSQPTNE